VLSHTGIEDDVRMAKAIPQIDVIVGGHSHTIMGNFKNLGIKNRATRYPRVIKHSGGTNTLIVQAGYNLEMLGILLVTFDDNGAIKDFEGNPLLLAGHTHEIDKITELKNVALVDEDAAAKLKLAEFAQPIKKLKETVIATATEDLKQTGNEGLGPIVAESMLAKGRIFGAQLALMNTTGIRCDIPKGPITIAHAYELLPFENKLVIVKMKGHDLRATLEEIINRNVSKKRNPPYFFGVNYSIL